MSTTLGKAALLAVGLPLLLGCGGDPRERATPPTAPGFATPSIRGAYASASFWTFDAVRLADATRFSWTCRGRVTVVRQSGADFLGTFASALSAERRCDAVTGDIIGGVVRRDASITFDTIVPGRDPGEFFALPGCALVTQDTLWSGRANGDRFFASRGLTVDCPAEGRIQVTARADGSRTDPFASP